MKPVTDAKWAKGLLCGNCGHFITSHWTRGCRTPNCKCIFKTKENK